MNSHARLQAALERLAELGADDSEKIATQWDLVIALAAQDGDEATLLQQTVARYYWSVVEARCVSECPTAAERTLTLVAEAAGTSPAGRACEVLAILSLRRGEVTRAFEYRQKWLEIYSELGDDEATWKAELYFSGAESRERASDRTFVTCTSDEDCIEWLRSLPDRPPGSLEDLMLGFGKYVTNDMRFVFAAKSLLSDTTAAIARGLHKPRNFLLLGDPGSGKSFFVGQFAECLGATRVFKNISAYRTRDEAIRDILLDVITGLLARAPIAVFLDEADSLFEGQWLIPRLIAMINGEDFFFEGKSMSLGGQPALFFFAMSRPWEDLHDLPKAEDFLSRIPEHHRIALPTITSPIERVLRSLGVVRRLAAIKEVELSVLVYVAFQGWASTRELELFLTRAVSRGRATPDYLKLADLPIGFAELDSFTRSAGYDLWDRRWSGVSVKVS